jgi:hypothetical protein
MRSAIWRTVQDNNFFEAATMKAARPSVGVIVERAFGLGACALAEAVARIGERLEIQPA